MATTDLKAFLENRLVALDPTMDIADGSPAQVKFIQPVLSYLGTDPFETDIENFILDRFAQEFPGTYAADPGVVNDTLVKPTIILFEPFKREIQTIRRNQSIMDPTALSDDDADALAANFFETRTAGSYSTVVVRAFFQSPTNITIDITNRFYTSSGVSFFPVTPFSVTAEEMVFNRSGSLYYIDVPCKAESAGSSSVVGADTVIGVEGMIGVVKVTNPRPSTSAADTMDTPTFLANTAQALTERSLTNRRGATARILDSFNGVVKAVQVIGAQDPEMQRDLLVATSPGHAWLTGQVKIYGKVAFVQCRTVDDSSTSPTVSEGDTLYIYLDRGSWPGLSQQDRFVRLTVDKVLLGPVSVPAPFQVAFMVQWSGSVPPQLQLNTPVTVEGGFSKKGTVKVSSLPGVGSQPFEVGNGEVHVLGHVDVYVRPTTVSSAKCVINNLYDDKGKSDFLFQRVGLYSTSGSVCVQDPGIISFSDAGVIAGDVLTIETGDDTGSYRVLEVSSNNLYLDKETTHTASGLKYSVSRRICINPFEPKVLKLPYGDVLTNDLTTVIGSKVFQLRVNDALDYGAKVGDTVRITSGDMAGDYAITGFVSSGRRIEVDRAATGTFVDLQYEIFTPLEKVELPLVRIKQLMLLDSSKQSTGGTIPPADPVGNISVGAFTGAQVRGKSRYNSGFVVPAMYGFINNPVVDEPAPNTGSAPRRYSDGYEYHGDGFYKGVEIGGGGYSEFLYPYDSLYECSYFLATCEDYTNQVNYPPIDPKPGECLTIKSGPNKGSYVIKSIRKFKYNGTSGDVWVYLIKIHGTFPVDVFKSLVNFLDDNGQHVDKLGELGTVVFPDFFVDFYDSLPGKIDAVLGSSSPGVTSIKAMADGILRTEYEWGDPARGVVRTYFQEPTLIQMNTATNSNPTLFTLKSDSGDLLKFRPDPTRYESHDVVPARDPGDADVLEYPRDLTSSGSTVIFSTDGNPTLFARGVVPGDVLSVYAERRYYGGWTGDSPMQAAVRTTAGSTVVNTDFGTAGVGITVSSTDAGSLMFIDEGDDKGAYRIVDVLSPTSFTVDKPMTRTTPDVIKSGTGRYGKDAGGANRVEVNRLLDSYVGQYITLFGMDFQYQGSYRINAYGDDGYIRWVDVEKSPDFPDVVDKECRWVVSPAPETSPGKVRSGTELLYQPIRIYEDVPVNTVFQDIEKSISQSKGYTDVSVPNGYMQPYRIFRPNIRRVNPTEMEDSRDGPYYFVDTDVVSLSPNPSSNIPKGSYLTAVPGTYLSQGHTHEVEDRSLSYSTKESGRLVIPSRVLPTGVPDSVENELSLTGSPVQVTYESGSVVSDVQDFVESALDRTASANMLARHFLPSAVSFWATYIGGSATSVVAKDIIDYINNLSVETPVDVSVIQGLIDARGGNPETPVKVFNLVTGWDRKAWLEINENELGGILTKVPFDGTTRVLFFASGPDVSGQTPVPAGESINLTRG